MIKNILQKEDALTPNRVYTELRRKNLRCPEKVQGAHEFLIEYTKTQKQFKCNCTLHSTVKTYLGKI